MCYLSLTLWDHKHSLITEKFDTQKRDNFLISLMIDASLIMLDWYSLFVVLITVIYWFETKLLCDTKKGCKYCHATLSLYLKWANAIIWSKWKNIILLAIHLFLNSISDIDLEEMNLIVSWYKSNLQIMITSSQRLYF